MVTSPTPSADTLAAPPVHDYAALRRSVRELCEQQIAPYAAETDRTGQFPTQGYQALRSGGLHAPRIAREYGGLAADPFATAIVIEEVARVCATTAVIPAINTVGSLALESAASEELRRTYLPRIAQGETLISFCVTEREAGSDVAALRTRAVTDGDSFVVSGVKRWITHAGESALYVVFAVTDPDAGPRGISAFLVERDDPGVSFGVLERKLGIRGSPTRELVLDQVRLSAGRMIGRPGTGLGTALVALDHGRVGIAAQATGIAQGALDCAVDYVRQRSQFGRRLADLDGVRMMLAEMATRVEAARSLTRATAETATDPGELRVRAAMAKCFASDVAMSVTTDAVQLLGGNGFSCNYPAERMMRDAKITQIYEGANQVLRLVIARGIVGGEAGA